MQLKLFYKHANYAKNYSKYINYNWNLFSLTETYFNFLIIQYFSDYELKNSI
jgi:hypothetical protein